MAFLYHKWRHEYRLSGNKAFIQKEVLNANVLNTIFIPPWFHIVFDNYDFLEGIRYSD